MIFVNSKKILSWKYKPQLEYANRTLPDRVYITGLTEKKTIYRQLALFLNLDGIKYSEDYVPNRKRKNR